MSPSPQFTAKRITPTPQQLAVQTASAQTLLIEANAGAAKTTTLALRMAEGWARGEQYPWAFTSAAVESTTTAALTLTAG